MVNLGLNYLNSLSLYVPEAIALVIMVGLVFLEATYDHGEKRKMTNYFSLIGLAVVAILLFLNLESYNNAIPFQFYASTMAM